MDDAPAPGRAAGPAGLLDDPDVHGRSSGPSGWPTRSFLSEEEAALLQEQLTAEGVDPLRRDAVAIEDPDEREAALYQENRDASYVHYD